ncbi:MAG: patatin-like phospholipase family protein [Elusimicrobia bacterium]|nr:patatin-like phospholipase family protein [Elusimicrobiota bacterium]
MPYAVKSGNLRLAGGLILLLLLSGCGPKKGFLELLPGSGRPRVALVLGGGAARGFAHIGVIRTLEQEKIPIDLIVGTSVGSLVGAIYADKADSFELEWNGFALEKEDIFDFSILRAKRGPVKGDRLENFVLQHVAAKNIEDLKIQYIAVAADLNTGKPVLLNKGPVAKAVRASSSIPGVFEPLEYQGHLLVDGGVVGNIAPEVARIYGADLVITVDIGKSVVNYNTDNVIDITLQAINIMGNKIDSYKHSDTDILIQPEVGDVGMMDFSQKKKCMTAGIEAARKNISKIKKLLAKK